jgi:hypothetical protein
VTADVRAPTETVIEHDGARVPTFVYTPPGPGPRPAAVLSPEAFGIMGGIDALDFAAGTHDILAVLDRRLAAAVRFFPSQPTFPELTPKRPVQPADLLWNVACPSW